uniref:Uncharacterized protein n=1 Tax=Palpitomonas bilix TaxID=652834 RepID=A0A7S3G6Y3_9EUKA|mmetsp:Transcript_26510/g.67836  ORF Transcript_26510/g.67836 Transcript_26510/m.67836 type:complete len:110 (+) Transcript_26510:1767-2096(+)
MQHAVLQRNEHEPRRTYTPGGPYEGSLERMCLERNTKREIDNQRRGRAPSRAGRWESADDMLKLFFVFFLFVGLPLPRFLLGLKEAGETHFKQPKTHPCFSKSQQEPAQ